MCVCVCVCVCVADVICNTFSKSTYSPVQTEVGLMRRFSHATIRGPEGPEGPEGPKMNTA